jgi:hypothetical protein
VAFSYRNHSLNHEVPGKAEENMRSLFWNAQTRISTRNLMRILTRIMTLATLAAATTCSGLAQSAPAAPAQPA